MHLDCTRSAPRWCALGALLWSFGASGAALAQTAAAELPIVQRAAAHHGAEVWRRSEITLDIGSKSGSFHIEAKLDGGLFDYRVSGERAGKRLLVRHHNDGVVRTVDGAEEALDAEGERRARDFVSARVYFPFLPMRLLDPNTFAVAQGSETWDGKALERVLVTFGSGTSTDADDAYLFWFDPETARLEQFAYSFDGGLRFRRLHNYRRVSGVLFADQQNFALDGPGLSVSAIDPRFVAERMALLSDVVLTNVSVRPLP